MVSKGTVHYNHLYVKFENWSITECALPQVYMILMLKAWDSKIMDLQIQKFEDFEMIVGLFVSFF